MNLSERVKQILFDAIEYATGMGYEYVTPETLLYILCKDAEFQDALEECGGDAADLSIELQTHMDAYYGADAFVYDKKNEAKLSEGVNQALAIAAQSAFSSGNKEVELRHLVFGILKLPESFAVYYMGEQDIDFSELLSSLSYEGIGESPEGPAEASSGKKENVYAGGQAGVAGSSQQYLPCMNDNVNDANPLIGREAELERTIQILCRKDKNNPLHLGEPGVGKTAIMIGLVQRINEGKVPKELSGCRVFSLDLGSMLAGTQYRGEFEKRFKRVLKDLEKEEKPIVYIDEIHNLSGSGAVGESSFDAANILKPYLSAGKIRFVGATTFEEYKKYFEKNKGLARRFQVVEIKEPTEEETVLILKGLKKKYEEFHKIVYDEDVIEYAVSMSARHINERFLPDKAIDLIDEAGAWRKLHPSKDMTVKKEVIDEVLTKICRVPIETVQSDDNKLLEGLEKRIKSVIFGQDEAVDEVVNAVKFSRAGLLEDGKPLASLLFVGPTGVGKTEVARALSKELGVKLLRFDMSEYEEKHTVAKLIGAPAGYVGYEEGGLLTEAVRKNPFCVLLLDEIEKAHADIYNILLQVMDYATLTDNQGRKADFRNVVLIMTSNAGANRLGKKGIGFESTAETEGVIMEEVKRIFQPEFRNRLNRIVVFNGMDDAMAQLIIEKKIKELKDMLAKKSIKLSVAKSALRLIKKKGVSEEFGAREIDRVIRNEVKPLLVDEILFGALKDGGRASLSEKDGEFLLKAPG